jgi:alpha-tubulin suppressor-like RCC1 family protein
MRKWLSLLLVCALLLSLFPAVAAVEAEEPFQTTPCVSVGLTHFVALKADGTVWTYGKGTSGQLGYPSSSTSINGYFAQVPGVERIKAVAAGNSFTLALREDGVLLAWGSNYYGQLGLGAAVSQQVDPTPVPLPEGVKIQAVSIHSAHVAALSEDGEVYAWGSGGAGLSEAKNYLPVKLAMPEGVKISQVSTSKTHTLALTADSEVYAWGKNDCGQLGIGSVSGSTVELPPTKVEFSADPSAGRPVQVAALSSGLYGSSALLTSEGQVFTCGRGLYGLHNDGSSTTVLDVFTRHPLSEIAEISFSGQHYLALSKYGKLWTWGNYDAAGGGLGHHVSGDYAPCAPISFDPGRIVHIWAGATNDSGITRTETFMMVEDGTLYEFDSTNVSKVDLYCRPVLAQEGGEPFNLLRPADYFQTTPKIAAGDYHTVALTANGAVWTWGKNDCGQRGDGTKTDSSRPVQITLEVFGVDQTFSRAKAIANGPTHSLALLDNRSVYAWGNMGSYSRLVPGKVESLSDIDIIAAGGNSSLAATSLRGYEKDPSLDYQNGKIYYWENSPEDVSAHTPTEITYPGSEAVVNVSTSGYHHFGMSSPASTGTGVWGKNDYGQLGLGRVSQSESPINQGGLPDVIVPSPSGNFTAGFDSSTGKLYLWGADRLLDPSSNQELAPILPITQLTGVDQVAALAVGQEHIAVIKADGTVWTRGLNTYGQLGSGQAADQMFDFSGPVKKSSGATLSLAYNPFPSHLLSLSTGLGTGEEGEILGAAPDEYAQGKEITVTAKAKFGWAFDHWTAEGITLDDPTGATITFSMPGHAVSLTAHFEKDLPGGTGSDSLFLAEVGAPSPDAIAISTPEELAKIGVDPAFSLSGNYVLTADLDLSSYHGGQWVPLASPDAPFTGTLDGQGHVIRHMTITGNVPYAGLFSKVDVAATVRNLGLEEVSIDVSASGGNDEKYYVGGIAGVFGESHLPTDPSIKAALANCYVTGSISADLIRGTLYLGGLAGQLASDVSDCFNLAALSGRAGSTAGYLYMGGIAGYIFSSYLLAPSTIQRCYNDGTIQPANTPYRTYAGGIVGWLNIEVALQQCYNTSDLWLPSSLNCGQRAILGGIAGYSVSSIQDCYNLGNIGADRSELPHAQMYCGGIVGFFYPGNGDDTYYITNCYTTGKVVARASSQARAGGMVGFVDTSTAPVYVKNSLVLSEEISCYYDPDPSGTGASDPFYADIIGYGTAKYYLNVHLRDIASSGYSSLVNSTSAASASKEWAQKPESYTQDGMTWDFEQVWTQSPAQNDALPYFAWNSPLIQILDYSDGAVQLYSRLPTIKTTVCAASYSAEGQLLQLRLLPTSLEGGFQSFHLPLADSGAVTKVFLFRSTNLKPLVPAITP